MIYLTSSIFFFVSLAKIFPIKKNPYKNNLLVLFILFIIILASISLIS